LRKKLQGDNEDDPRLRFRHGDANDYIKQLGNHLQKNARHKAIV
jgi:hypothetical protein